MLFKRKKYKSLKKYRENLENLICDIINPDLQTKYFLLEGNHFLRYGNSKKIELEYLKIRFIEHEFLDIVQKFNKSQIRNNKINSLLKDK